MTHRRPRSTLLDFFLPMRTSLRQFQITSCESSERHLCSTREICFAPFLFILVREIRTTYIILNQPGVYFIVCAVFFSFFVFVFKKRRGRRGPGGARKGLDFVLPGGVADDGGQQVGRGFPNLGRFFTHATIEVVSLFGYTIF